MLIASLIGALVLGSGYFALDRLADRSMSRVSSLEPATASTPVLSARRGPQTLSFVSRTGSLRRAIEQMSGQVPTNGCLRVDWMGETMFALRDGLGLTPASVSKVITAAVALEILGPDHTYETAVYADRSGTSSTVGTLHIVGGGDPVLVTNQYVASEKYPTRHGTPVEELAQQIASSGVRLVTNAINVVDSKYDDVRYIDSWPTSFHGVEAGPLGALMINDSTVTGESMKRDDPAIAAGAQLQMELTSRGVTSTTNIQRIETLPPSASKIASITSAPLSRLIIDMLVNSDNNSAELMVKEIGHKATGVGSTQSGLQVIAEQLRTWGIDQGVTIADGSGLSRDNVVSCATMMVVLEKFADVLPSALAVAGRTGTLRDQFLDSRVEERLTGKTGTLNGVKSLVGYLTLDEEADVAYSLIMNATGIDNQGSYRPIWAALGDALARARATPRTDQLLP